MGGRLPVQGLLQHDQPRPMSSPSRAAKGALALLACAAAATGAAAQPELEAAPRRLSTSTTCRFALDGMVTDVNWRRVHNASSRWCRIRFENQMAQCCSISNFPQGTADQCDESKCVADCQHTHMAALCPSFGQACLVRRNPFTRTGPFADIRLSDGPLLQVLETFCVPSDCNNGPDRDALMQWYNVRYRADRSGWQANYDQAVLECDSGILVIILATIACIAILILCVPVLWFICVAPKERGRTLVSQAEMNADNSDAVEPLDAKSTRDQFMGTGQQTLY
uniref:Uncharacterized protein n=1 Tax=Alexandrium andersonii TaxID=327968 RepID=A0A7S2IC74_9DINO